MKELKFRAWGKKCNRYLKITGIQYDDDKLGGAFVVYGTIAGIPNTIFLEQEDVILEQYTGLKDKNGKKIYEGDIVRYAIRPSRTTVVEWWSGEEEYYPCCTTSGFSLPYSEDGYEVIGNVHENHELLEREDAGN